MSEQETAYLSALHLPTVGDIPFVPHQGITLALLNATTA